jgi:tetratricopeptide (TPR) repeat protein
MLERQAGEASREELRQLDALTAARDFGAVLKVGAPLLMKPWSAEDLALVRFYLGQAHCRLVEPREALVCLGVARQQFELQKDERLVVESLDWEASAWGLLEDPRATAIENEALERCRKLDPPQRLLEARILGHLANMFVVTRSWSRAIAYYEAAIEAASAVTDLLQLAKMHHGLGMAHQGSQQSAQARGHLNKALVLYSIESDHSAVYRVENDLGNLLLAEGRLDAAERHFLKALAGAEELHINRRGRGYILANLGEVCMRSGRTEEARRYLEDALAVGEAFGERIVLADASMLLGRLEEGLEHPGSADDHYGSAIRALEEIEMPNRLRDCYVEYAQVLESRGDMRAAYRQLQLAIAAEGTTAAETAG